jgi:hypothetical protein
MRTIRDGCGNTTGLMDQITYEYLTSEKNNPTQASLDEILYKTTKITISMPHHDEEQRRLYYKKAFEYNNPEEVRELTSFFRVDEEKIAGHLMSIPDMYFEFYNDDDLLANIAYISCCWIRWDMNWKGDGILEDSMPLMKWLDSKGITEPLEYYYESVERGKKDKAIQEHWEKGMPEYIIKHWNRMEKIVNCDFLDYSHLKKLLKELKAHYKDDQKLILALFNWFGHGSGLWSGHPSTESIPHDMLIQFPMDLLVNIALENDLNEWQLKGAAHFFGQREYNSPSTGLSRKCIESKNLEKEKLPLELIQKLREHVGEQNESCNAFLHYDEEYDKE